MKKVIVIPARFKSSRFPGKPLVDIMGKTLLERVYSVCLKADLPVYVATDDERIEQHCKDLGMSVIMTPDTCLTGTDRLYEFSKQLNYDLYINVQGDEPLIDVNDIRLVVGTGEIFYDTVCCGMTDIDNEDDYRSPNVPKVASTLDDYLLYMSRAPIPSNKEDKFLKAKKQVCIYSFPKRALIDFGEYGRKGEIEKIEDIEILRFLEMGHRVKMVNVSGNSVAVDIPSDVDRVVEVIKSKGNLYE